MEDAGSDEVNRGDEGVRGGNLAEVKVLILEITHKVFTFD